MNGSSPVRSAVQAVVDYVVKNMMAPGIALRVIERGVGAGLPTTV
jgi:hypothetical protein